MNEQKLMNLLDSLNVEQTTRLLKGVEIASDPVTSKRLVRRTAKRTGEKSKRQFKVLIPVAVCACACAILFAGFPETAEAIWNFFTMRPSVESYLETPKGQRPEIPELEAAIHQPTAAPDANVMVKIGSEMEGWEEIGTWRSDNGVAPLDENAYAWLREVKPEIKEVLYDAGNMLLVSGVLHTNNPLPFYDIPSNGGQAIGLVDAVLEYGEGENAVRMSGVCNMPVDEKARTYTENGDELTVVVNEEYVRTITEVPFIARFHLLTQLDENGNLDTRVPEKKTMLPEEITPARMTVEINDYSVDDMAGIGRMASIAFDTTIDGSKAAEAPQKDTAEVAPIALKGNAIATLYYGDPRNMQGSITVQNEELSMDGATVVIDKVEQGLEEIDVWYTLTLPDSWSEEQCKLYATGCVARASSLTFRSVLNGEEDDIYTSDVEHASGRTIQFKMNAWLMPSTIETWELTPVMEYMSEISTDHPTNEEELKNQKWQQLPLGGKTTIDISKSNGFGVKTGRTVFEDAQFKLIG